jgi:mRNA interferase RelE/StbE
MDSFKIDLRGSSEDDLKKIDRQYIPKIIEEIGCLAENPFPVQSKKLKDSESSYRLRVGDYRVIYQVDRENRTIVIYHIRHRKDAYKR